MELPPPAPPTNHSPGTMERCTVPAGETRGIFTFLQEKTRRHFLVVSGSKDQTQRSCLLCALFIHSFIQHLLCTESLPCLPRRVCRGN